MTNYDDSNIFAKVLRGEIEHQGIRGRHAAGHDGYLPQSRGHTLVIPKAPSRNLLDADPAVLAGVAQALPRFARAVKDGMSADGVRLVQYNEAPAGQTVFHLHFHLIPVYEGRGAWPPWRRGAGRL